MFSAWFECNFRRLKTRPFTVACDLDTIVFTVLQVIKFCSVTQNVTTSLLYRKVLPYKEWAGEIGVLGAAILNMNQKVSPLFVTIVTKQN